MASGFPPGDAIDQAQRPSQLDESGRKLRVAYHGPVFDSSGYGNAARSNIHALHRTGVELAVRDVATVPVAKVRCGLIESLLGPPGEVDFHVFHGVPTIWAREASALKNAIGITVWETDTVPRTWLDSLQFPLDIWVPSKFNQAVFSQALGRQPFCFPHPLGLHTTNWSREQCSTFLRVPEEAFLIYAIFDWQERKSPEQVIRAYLMAFELSDRTVLFIKTNPVALSVAQETLVRLRSEIRSDARVELRCEVWEEAQIAALHFRGDCYLSLHKGEGWCYPLCEAAARGKAVVATGYSGPLDYLDPSVHHLVRHSLVPVRQKYRYYHESMLWAEPDQIHAVECLRAAYAEHDSTFTRTHQAAHLIRQKYSLEEVGRMAGQRLNQLLDTPVHD